MTAHEILQILFDYTYDFKLGSSILIIKLFSMQVWKHVFRWVGIIQDVPFWQLSIKLTDIAEIVQYTIT